VVHNDIQRRPPLYHILSQCNSLYTHTYTPYFCNICINTILPSATMSPHLFLPFMFSYQNCIHFLFDPRNVNHLRFTPSPPPCLRADNPVQLRQGHFMAQTVSRRLPTAAAFLDSKSGHVGFVMNFLCLLRFLLPIITPPTAAQSLIILSSALCSLESESVVK
jgi:hypothetical protein